MAVSDRFVRGPHRRAWPGGGRLAETVRRRGGAPDTEVEPDRFWSGFAELVHELAPRNRELLATRASMQAAIDAVLLRNHGLGVEFTRPTATGWV